MKVRVLLTGGLERYTKPVASFARTLPLVNYFLIVINQASRQLVAECACAHLPRCPQVATCKCAADDKARVRMVERPMARARQHGAQCGGRKTRWALATVHSGLALGVQCTPSRGCGGMWDVGCGMLVSVLGELRCAPFLQSFHFKDRDVLQCHRHAQTTYENEHGTTH